MATSGAYHLLIVPPNIYFSILSGLFVSLLAGSCLGYIAGSGILASAKDVKGLWEELDRDGSGTIGIEDGLPANVVSQLNSMIYSVHCASRNVTERATSFSFCQLRFCAGTGLPFSRGAGALPWHGQRERERLSYNSQKTDATAESQTMCGGWLFQNYHPTSGNGSALEDLEISLKRG